MAKNDYGNYYEVCQATSELEFNKTVEHARRYARLVSDKSQPVLDFGCGAGSLLKALSLEGFQEIEGIDQSAIQAKKAISQVPGAQVSSATDTLAWIQTQPSGKYGSIFLMDVLEHIDPKNQGKLLVELVRCLQTEGVLILKVPNALSGVGMLMRYDDYQHTSIFTANSLRGLCLAQELPVPEVFDEFPWDTRPAKLMTKGWVYWWWYRAMQKMVRKWQWGKIAAECGIEKANACLYAPNIVACLKKKIVHTGKQTESIQVPILSHHSPAGDLNA